MTHQFDADAIAGVLHHMNADHTDDNVLITRAFLPGSEVVSATMGGFDGDGGDWTATLSDGRTVEVRVPWPGGGITERREVRREIVALYDQACRALGVEPRAHD
ncbi:DUF2470 domain-containing protein [Microbacterium sp. BWT-B31]|uniref:DUF2470 domain-containing protein n=1 Tax=Microbacterium sp. BWT-B31 TaxID=3232072 RepID=UPI003527B902